MENHIRLATTHDLAEIEHVVLESYKHYVERIGRKPGPMLDDYTTLIKNQHVHVVERGSLVVGFIVLLPKADAMLLDNVAVLPAAQGSGIGRLLLEFAEQVSKEAGFSALKLYTNEAMTENIDLYKRIGYTETHRAQELGLRRVYMTKPL